MKYWRIEKDGLGPLMYFGTLTDEQQDIYHIQIVRYLNGDYLKRIETTSNYIPVFKGTTKATRKDWLFACKSIEDLGVFWGVDGVKALLEYGFEYKQITGEKVYDDGLEVIIKNAKYVAGNKGQ